MELFANHINGFPDAVHDGLIFDINEDFALTLCRENLDALCSTPLRQSIFQAVATGYIFYDQKNNNRIKQHTKNLAIHGLFKQIHIEC